MDKVNLYDLASVLVSKYEIDKNSARSFIQAFVETIHEGVLNDRQVKIKGLGTFKVVGVESRESVNVNTGERVVIDSHNKLTFTPDAAMKELVNRPFSQFETVILNDGVTFDEISEPEIEPGDDDVVSQAEESKALVAESTPVPVVVEESVPVVEEESAPVEQKPEKADAEPAVHEIENIQEEPDVTQEEPNTQESEPDMQEEEQTDQQQEQTDQQQAEDASTLDLEENNVQKSFPLQVLLLVLCAVLVGGLIGFIIGRNMGETPEKLQVAVKVEPVSEPADSLQAAPDSLVPVVQIDTIAKQDTVAPQVQKDTVPFYKQFEAKDVRIRTGAYRIVGTARVVKAREGQTIHRLSKAILGEGMECYLEAYNDIKANEPLKEGQEIKIPKLEWKLKKSKK